MISTPRWLKLKYLWWAILLIYGALSYFGAPIPKDWNSTKVLLRSFDQWVFKQAAYPGLFLLFVALVIGTAIAPEAARIAKSQLRASRSRGDISGEALADAIAEQTRQRYQENDPYYQMFQQKQRVALGQEINPRALELEVGESGKFVQTRARGLYSAERTFNLSVKNTDGRFPISGCKIQIVKLEPQTEYSGPWLIKSGIALAAGDQEFVPLVSYGESDSTRPEPRGDTFMVFRVPEPAPKPSAGATHVVTLRATSLETSPREIRCKVWVSPEGRLRIAKV